MLIEYLLCTRGWRGEQDKVFAHVEVRDWFGVRQAINPSINNKFSDSDKSYGKNKAREGTGQWCRGTVIVLDFHGLGRPLWVGVVWAEACLRRRASLGGTWSGEQCFRQSDEGPAVRMSQGQSVWSRLSWRGGRRMSGMRSERVIRSCCSWQVMGGSLGFILNVIRWLSLRAWNGVDVMCLDWRFSESTLAVGQQQ